MTSAPSSRRLSVVLVLSTHIKSAHVPHAPQNQETNLGTNLQTTEAQRETETNFSHDRSIGQLFLLRNRHINNIHHNIALQVRHDLTTKPQQVHNTRTFGRFEKSGTPTKQRFFFSKKEIITQDKS